MLGRVSSWVVLGVLLVAGTASQASAQFGPGGYGLGFFNYGGNYYGGNYRVPYYALFPPVYYSYPVPRTYGYSPFAYPPGTVTPAAAPQTAAVEYINPYVDQPGSTPSKETSTADKTASTAPRMYLNPYVKQAQTAASN